MYSSNSIIGTIDFLLYGPELTMLWTLMFFLCFGVHYSNSTGSPENSYRTASSNTALKIKSGSRYNVTNVMWADWAFVWCFCTFVMLCYSYDYTASTIYGPLQSGVYVRSNLSIGLSKYLFLWTGLVCLFIRNQKGGIEESFLYLLSAFAMHTMIMSVDLCSLFISLELQSFCIVVLCVIYQNSISSVEAALKYFLLSAFSSALLVLGISLVYCFIGSTDLYTLFTVLSFGNAQYNVGAADFALLSGESVSEATALGGPRPFLTIAVWFIAIALLWKLAAAPLHMWAADVYQGIPSGVTMFLSTVPKLAVLGFLSSGGIALTGVPFVFNAIQIVFCFFAAMCLLIGSYSALGQVSFKRLLAYSSIAQMGFLLMPLITGSIETLMTHITVYIATSMALWGVFMWPSMKPQYIWNWTMFYKTHPEAAFTTALLLTSLAGLPPLAGFLGKLVIFKNCLENTSLMNNATTHIMGPPVEGNSVLAEFPINYTLVALGLFSTIISTYYYVRFIRVMYGKGVDVSLTGTSSALYTQSAHSHLKSGVFKSRMEPVHSYVLTILVLFLCSLLWYSSPLLMYHQLIGF
jgi:NADH-quinone oxidoreductase subunit N